MLEPFNLRLVLVFDQAWKPWLHPKYEESKEWQRRVGPSTLTDIIVSFRMRDLEFNIVHSGVIQGGCKRAGSLTRNSTSEHRHAYYTFVHKLASPVAYGKILFMFVLKFPAGQGGRFIVSRQSPQFASDQFLKWPVVCLRNDNQSSIIRLNQIGLITVIAAHPDVSVFGPGHFLVVP